MHNDQMIMGCCGETRIANKRQSWVTAIQVFEYFISHHMVKAFESVFGGVSCLPGCFSMFRLKARKASGDEWVPLIIKPEIVKEYSQSIVTTLHQKNLLLLGEDRFLTTILLRTFPNRKMVFLPQARCRTVVPDTFSMLLSQRRRWINSTVHNLMELVLVRDLCGTFCFSMQFVVFMDLVGTTVLPIAIALTYSLIVNMILSPPKTFEEAIPAMLLIAVLGLPAVLILITTRKVVYVFWMGAYLLALPVWNFVLPVYAFWHFDDFSWGETRYVHNLNFLFFEKSNMRHSCLTEKLKVKARIPVTVMEARHLRLYMCLSDDGKIGNARVCARLSVKKSEDASLSARMVVTLLATTACLLRDAAIMKARTRSPLPHLKTIAGGSKLAAIMKKMQHILPRPTSWQQIVIMKV
jgi:cellulose synthase/poly-beta-1,6-N-acetylglucosamine synthase-like glycosyltransferase